MLWADMLYGFGPIWELLEEDFLTNTRNKPAFESSAVKFPEWIGTKQYKIIQKMKNK